MSEPTLHVCKGCKRKVLSLLAQPDGWEAGWCRRCLVVLRCLQ